MTLSTINGPATRPSTELDELDRILRDDAVVSVYQPIVELASGEAVAYEALARGPQDSPLHLPSALFGAAERHGRLVELDWACRAAALRGALGTPLERPNALFVNVEPVASAARVPEQFASVVAGASGSLRVVFEFTERALTERPADVLRSVSVLRSLGGWIALDDVGVDPRSLALMPFLRPEVIKLDMSVVQEELSPHKARTIHAVRAHAESFGTLILAEGIESEEHLERARFLGAAYGQGWLFGRPEAPPTRHAAGAVLPRVETIGDEDHNAATSDTPYARVRATGGPVRVASKRLLLALSQQLELHAEGLGPECVVLSSLQDVRHFTPRTQARYQRLAEQTAFAGVLGTGIDAAPAPGVRGGSLKPGEPLTREWTVCVVSPHFAAAMVATDLGDTGVADLDRRFEYCLTYDRHVAVHAARPLMARIAAAE